MSSPKKGQMLAIEKQETIGQTTVPESPTSDNNLATLQDQLKQMKSMDFNSLLKVNPFSGALRDVITKCPQVQQPEDDEDNPDAPTEESLFKQIEKKVSAKEQELQQKEKQTKPQQPPQQKQTPAKKQFNRTQTLQSDKNVNSPGSSPNTPLKSNIGKFPSGILKVGQRSKYSKGYNSYFGYNSACFELDDLSRDRSASLEQKAKSRGFFISSSFDAANSNSRQPQNVKIKTSQFKKNGNSSTKGNSSQSSSGKKKKK